MDYVQLIFAEVRTSLTILHFPKLILHCSATNTLWLPIQAGIIGVVKIDGRLRRLGRGLRRGLRHVDGIWSVGVQSRRGLRWRGPITEITLPGPGTIRGFRHRSKCQGVAEDS